jgi:hypothetical protein
LDSRAVDERRFASIQALRAVAECLRESSPQSIFGGKDSLLDSTKIQSISNRWADKAADVLLRALELADRIAVDTLELFAEVDDAASSGTRPSDA